MTAVLSSVTSVTFLLEITARNDVVTDYIVTSEIILSVPILDTNSKL